MKKACISLLLGFGFFISRAQFGPAVFIDTLTGEVVSQLACADFNHDGVNDILTANLHWPKDNMKIYLQTGDLSFQVQSIPAADSLSQLESFAAGDIRKDGWMDFVVASEVPYSITWYENNEGTFIPHPVDDSLDFTTQVLLEDFNHDGLLDILSLQHVEIVLYLAIEEGVFGPAQVIHAGTEFYAIDAAQYNHDTFPDVAVASDGFEILLNDGEGHFTLQSEQGLGLDFGLQSADLDGDWDVDIAVYRTLAGILFYSNDGDGNFELRDTILASADNFDSYQLADMNCDNVVDLYTSLPQQGRVIWVENDGSGHFAPPSLIHEQAGELVAAVATGDLNGDDRQDALWGNLTLGANLNQCMPVAVDEVASETNKVFVYPNPSPGDITILNREEEKMTEGVYDQLGRQILPEEIVLPQENIVVYLPNAGMFYVRGVMGDGKGDVQVVVKGQ